MLDYNYKGFDSEDHTDLGAERIYEEANGDEGILDDD